MNSSDHQDVIALAALIVLLLFAPVRVSQLDGTQVTAVMKHKTVDFRDAVMEGDSATLSVRALAGTVDIRVPENWNVKYDDAWIIAHHDASPTLFVEGETILGAITVSH